MAPPLITYRTFISPDLPRIRDIDRSEGMDVLYIQRGTQLAESHGNFDSPNWSRTGEGEHSYARQQAHVEKLLASGAVALGAFDGERLVGIGVLVPHLRRGIAQLAYLHVSNGYRWGGIGKRLSDDLDRIAREGGATEIASPPRRLRTRCAFTWRVATSPWPSRSPNSLRWSRRTSTSTSC